MGNIVKSFEDLEAWQLGKQRAVMAYRLTGNFPERETFGLSDQIRRAATSIPGNAAEGFAHYHYTDRARFHVNARGSLNEVKSHLLISEALEFLDRRSLQPALELRDTLGIKPNNFIAATRRAQSSPRGGSLDDQLP